MCLSFVFLQCHPLSLLDADLGAVGGWDFPEPAQTSCMVTSPSLPVHLSWSFEVRLSPAPVPALWEHGLPSADKGDLVTIIYGVFLQELLPASNGAVPSSGQVHWKLRKADWGEQGLASVQTLRF